MVIPRLIIWNNLYKRLLHKNNLIQTTDVEFKKTIGQIDNKIIKASLKYFKVKKKEKIAFEHGYTLAVDVEKNLFRNITIKTEQKIFINPQNTIQVDLESNTEINYALSKNLKLIFKHQLIFDADISEQAQRQTLFLLGYYF